MSEERRVCVTHRIDWPCPSCALHSAEREVLEAGLALLAKHDNPEVRAGLDSAFQLAWVHGMRYTGPTWEAELERMRTAASRYRALLDGKEAK